MSQPYFSIIIPTFNSYEKLQRAIESIKGQTFTDFEVIIVDDGSTDGTQAKIQKRLYKKIHYFYKANGGPASARNLGIREASGEYLCFLDADDEFMPEKLLEYYTASQNGEVFLFSDAEYFNEKTKSSTLFSSKEQMRYGNCFQSLMENNFIVASTVCVKKSVLETTAYFDEALKIKFVEDYDLWLKIAKKYPLTYIEKPLTKYYIHESNNSSNVQRTYTSLIAIYSKWSFSSLIAMKNLLKYTFVLSLHRMGMRK
jgi:glycosyltransferase involved in cell wall biosynthesis